MKLLVLVLFTFSMNTFSSEVIVKLKAAQPLSLNWKKIAPSSKGRLSKVYLYQDSTKTVKKLKEYILKNYDVEYVEEKLRFSSITQSLSPSLNSTLDTNDPLSVYQWALKLEGQKVYQEITDIEMLLTKNSKQADLGINSIKRIQNDIKTEVVVAVIDSGVDIDHPDLRGNILKKEDECENGEIPFEPEPTHGDPYPGDCMGWDFTGKKEGGSNRPYDFAGHGTHIAGIISSVTDNDIGLSGISNKIKILPIKALSIESESTHVMGTSLRLIKSLEYARVRKVDVVNLSLGWPSSFDKGHLRDAILDLIDEGIVIVAAAGNNDHSEPIMPCGYEGVLCVGSNDVSAKASDFSNFGAHVDVLAPGSKIMSTYPTSQVPHFSAYNGYEIKDGTSQAAPYISLLAALIKGINPDLTGSEIYNRIQSYQSPYNSDKKFFSGNVINFEDVLYGEKKFFIKPVFKNDSRVKVNAKDLSFSFHLRFEGNLLNQKFKVKSLGKLNLINDEGIISNFNKPVNIQGKLNSLDEEMLQKFKITINGKDYTFEKRFYVDFDSFENIRTFEVVGAIPKSMNTLSSVNYYHAPNNEPYYYSVVDSRDAKVIVLFKIDPESATLKRVGASRIENMARLMSIHVMDANSDGINDILINYLETKKDDSKIVYSYRKENLTPLYGQVLSRPGERPKIDDFSSFELSYEEVFLDDLRNYAWTKVNYEKFGTLLVPVFFSFSKSLPVADRSPNPFERIRNRAFSQRLYYYLPSFKEKKAIFTTRTLNTNNFTDKLKEKIGFYPFEQIYFTKFYKQSFREIQKGSFSFIFSLESERKKSQNFVMNVESLIPLKWNVTKLKGSSHFSSNYFSEVIDLDKREQKAHVNDYLIQASEKVNGHAFRNLIIDQKKIIRKTIKQKDLLNPLQADLKTYVDSDYRYRFYLTPSSIFLHREGEGSDVFTLPTHVSSFLPGHFFKEQQYFFSFLEDDKFIPAIFVNSTEITTRNIKVTKFSKGSFQTPIRFNTNIPKNCDSLNPIVTDLGHFEYVLKCVESDRKAKILYIPLKIGK